MPVGRTLISGSPYVGVFVRVTDRFAVLAPSVGTAIARDVARLLGVTAIRTTVCDSEIVGALIAANSHGVVASEGIDSEEARLLEEIGPVAVVRHRQNAMGNNILANDFGALVHPEFSPEAMASIGRALGVPAEHGTLAGLGTVGMAGVATNKGVVVHPKATDKEVASVERLLKVPVGRSTGNFGVPIVGACVIANSRGVVVGRPTTPVEIMHVQEGLSVFD